MVFYRELSSVNGSFCLVIDTEDGVTGKPAVYPLIFVVRG